MASSRWVYASGSHWIRFDSTTSREIEKMFVKGGAGWVNIRAFGGQVYVNAIGCYVCANSGLRFTIARMLDLGPKLEVHTKVEVDSHLSSDWLMDIMASFLRVARSTTARRSTLLAATASISAAPRARIAPQLARGYATGEPKKGGNTGVFLGLAALGAAGGYYYYSTTQDVKVGAKTTEKSLDKKPIDYQEVYNAIADILEDNDYDDGSIGPVLVRLAWHASGTYDDVTKTGGSNGATMRFEPEALHGANNGLAIARDRLMPIKQKFPEISYGDLWTLAGVCGVQELGGPTIPWRPGRQDALDGKSCTPDGRLPDASQGERHVRDIFYRMGFNDQEIVALAGAHSLGRCHPDRSGFEGPWQEAPTMFTNEYFKALRDRKWIKKTVKASGVSQFVDKNNPDVMMLPAEIAMKNDKEFSKYISAYADNEEKFFEDFAKVFNKLLELGVPFKGNERVYHFKPTTA